MSFFFGLVTLVSSQLKVHSILFFAQKRYDQAGGLVQVPWGHDLESVYKSKTSKQILYLRFLLEMSLCIQHDGTSDTKEAGMGALLLL